MLVVLESKTWKQGAKSGQNFHENKCLLKSSQSTEKVKLPTEIIKINLDVEKDGGLGLKTTMKRTNRGQNLHEN